MFAGLREYTPPVSAYCVPLAIVQRLVEIAHLDHREHRAEDLLLGDDGRGRHVREDVRRDVEALGRQEAHVAGVSQPRFLLALRDVADDPLAGIGVDHGADAGRRVLRGADLQAPRRLDQALKEIIVHRFQHDGTRAGRALLPRIAECAGRDADDRLVEVGIVIDDDARSCRPARR